MKLQIFEAAMDECSKAELHLHRRRGTKVTFDAFYAGMENRHGMSKDLGLRKVWQEVSLPTGKKVNRNEWLDFKVRFETAQLDVTDATPTEAYRLLMEKLPPFISNWVVEHEDKLFRTKPTLVVGGIPGMTGVGMMDSLAIMTGHRPVEVTHKFDRVFWVKLENEEQADRLLERNGCRVDEGRSVMVVQRLEQNVTVEQIFTLVSRKFELRDRQDMRQSLNEGSRNTRNQRQATTGETTIIPDKKDPPKDTQKILPRADSTDSNVKSTPPLSQGWQG